MLSLYVPTSLTLPPAPVIKSTIFVPEVIPVPLRVCPCATAPEPIAVTVSTSPVIEPVKDAPIKLAVDATGPIVY